MAQSSIGIQRDHTGHPRASWAWSMACLQAKKFLIFHHSAPFVMENCTIYQTSETSLWENVARLVKRTVQSLIIVAPVKSGLFHVGSVWFGLIPTNSEVSHSWLYHTKDLILNGHWPMMIYSSSGDQWQIYIPLDSCFIDFTPSGPLQVLTMLVKQNCSIISTPSHILIINF